MASRREFLADVGKGMMLASIGPALSSDLGLSRGFAAEGSEALNFGKLESLVAFLQDTPTNKLMAETIKKLKDGTDLRTLVAAGALGERQIQIYPFRVSWTRRASRRKPDVDSRTPNFGRYHVGLTPRRSPGRCLGKFVPAARLSLLPVIAVVRSRPLQAPRDRLVSSVAILGHGSNTPRTVKIAKSEPLYKYQSYIFHPFPHYLQIPELWRSFQSPQLTGMSIRGGPILFSLDISTLQRPKT